MTQELKKLKTTEELLQWQEEIYELEKYAFAGIMSESEQEQRVNNLLDKNYYHHHLEKVRQRTLKLLEDLAYLEQREQLLLCQINKQEHSSQE
ncbi:MULTISPECIES: hypothetical protein [Nostocales]|uniref:Uncharacterized protein n=3 Tax=Nostocales TaxID=1161 RepID=A0A0C1N3C8_9CYAN|nr:hypothetical protein [Tolypothrix bouteillei]KAF3885229.1 hypothetical protein DA73_0400006975 [Tolypothrix bouteillei VB521301]